MQNTDTLFDEIRNVGYIDRGVRILAGSAAILFVLSTQPAGMLGWLAIIPLVAVYPIITGLVSFDPLYAWLQIDTSKSSAFSDERLMKMFGSLSDEHSAQSSHTTEDDARHNGKHSGHKNAA